MALQLEDWVLLNSSGSTVATCGKAKNPALALIKALKEHQDNISKLIGFDARSIMKGASIRAMAEGEVVPTWCWFYSFFDSEGAKIIDPLDMLTSGFKERIDLDSLLSTLPVKDVNWIKNADAATVQQRAEAALQLGKMMFGI